MKFLANLLSFLLCLSPGMASPKILVPMYDLRYANAIIAAAQKNRIAVILNIDSGPGEGRDSTWVHAISRLKSAKAELFGYVDLVRFKGGKSYSRSSSEIAEDCDVWWRIYGVNAYFYDDYRATTTKTLPNARSSIANPGYSMQTVCGTTMVWESESYLKSKPSHVQGKQAVFALGEDSYVDAYKLAKKRSVAYFYATDSGDNSKAYDDLPPYFAKLCRE